LVYTNDIFSSVNTNGVSDRKNLVSVSVCIHRFSGSDNAIGLNYAKKIRVKLKKFAVNDQFAKGVKL
jgi:hypothetical protein